MEVQSWSTVSKSIFTDVISVILLYLIKKNTIYVEYFRRNLHTISLENIRRKYMFGITLM